MTTARDPEEQPATAGSAGWGNWWLLVFTTLVAVLFGVSLWRTRELGRRLVEQERRVQQLESNDALGRTAILEQQLRVTVEQLRELEERIDSWSRLEQERERNRRPPPQAPPIPESGLRPPQTPPGIQPDLDGELQAPPPLPPLQGPAPP
jgi:uncharacterized coiled-coil protein SlyX